MYQLVTARKRRKIRGTSTYRVRVATFICASSKLCRNMTGRAMHHRAESVQRVQQDQPGCARYFQTTLRASNIGLILQFRNYGELRSCLRKCTHVSANQVGKKSRATSTLVFCIGSIRKGLSCALCVFL